MELKVPDIESWYEDDIEPTTIALDIYQTRMKNFSQSILHAIKNPFGDIIVLFGDKLECWIENDGKLSFCSTSCGQKIQNLNDLQKELDKRKV